MYKIFYCLSICLMISTPVLAQNAYSRKKVQPNFFIPKKELKQGRQENLPPFPILEDVETVGTTEENMNYLIPAQQQIEEATSSAPEPTKKIDLQAAAKSAPFEDDVKASSDFENTESYKNLVSQYQKDLQEAVKNKEIPNNQNIDSILEKMQDGQMLFVDDDFGK